MSREKDSTKKRFRSLVRRVSKSHARNKRFSKDKSFRAKRPFSRASKRFESKEYDGRNGKYRPRSKGDPSRSPGGRTYLIGREMRTSHARGRSRSRSVGKLSHGDKLSKFRRPNGPVKKLKIRQGKPFKRGERPKRGRAFAVVEDHYCPNVDHCRCGLSHVPANEFWGMMKEHEAKLEKDWYPAYGYYVKADHEGNDDGGWYPFEEQYDDPE